MIEIHWSRVGGSCKIKPNWSKVKTRLVALYMCILAMSGLVTESNKIKFVYLLFGDDRADQVCNLSVEFNWEWSQDLVKSSQ